MKDLEVEKANNVKRGTDKNFWSIHKCIELKFYYSKEVEFFTAVNITTRAPTRRDKVVKGAKNPPPVYSSLLHTDHHRLKNNLMHGCSPPSSRSLRPALFHSVSPHSLPTQPGWSRLCGEDGEEALRMGKRLNGCWRGCEERAKVETLTKLRHEIRTILQRWHMADSKNIHMTEACSYWERQTGSVNRVAATLPPANKYTTTKTQQLSSSAGSATSQSLRTVKYSQWKFPSFWISLVANKQMHMEAKPSENVISNRPHKYLTIISKMEHVW